MATQDPNGDQIIDIAVDWLQTNVLRLVVTRVIPLILGSTAVLGVLAWLQAKVGLDLDPVVLSSVLAPAMAGIIGVAFAYVRGHAKAADLGKVALEAKMIYQAGEQAIAAEGQDLAAAPPTGRKPTTGS